MPLIFNRSGHVMFLNFIRDHLANRIPEYVILVIVCLLVAVNLSLLLEIDIWRQDSMYYVSSYNDKLAEEGRWINYLLFRLLRLIPSDVAIPFSYACVIIFSYAIVHRVTNNFHFSLIFGFLCALVPVLPVQLEWPETLLIGFGVLAFSPLLQRSLPTYIFFPLTGILFFGTFSAFYFLMPLLFLKGLNYSRFWRLVVLWVGSFVLAYMATNFIVYVFTGNAIQLAGWRNPHYVVDMTSLLENITRAFGYLSAHIANVGNFIKPGVLAVLALIAVIISIQKKQYFAFVLALICSLAIYVSSIPVGIYVQERTALCSFIAILVAFFVYEYQTRKAFLAVMIVMFLVAVRMAMASHEGISWYKAHTDVLRQQFHAAIKHQPGEIRKVFIMVEMPEALTLFRRVEENLAKKNLFSEGFVHPQYWVPVLKNMGYNYYRVCPDLVGWDCEQVLPYYRQRAEYEQDHGLFISRRLPEGDLLLMINPSALK